MEVYLLVEREVGTEDSCWVIDAVDEYTVDEWNGAYPDQFREKLEATGTGTERRLLTVKIPDDALSKPWHVPAVEGQVSE